MSITVDPRAGSERLIKPLRKILPDVEVARMEFADVSFIGKGEEGAPVPVGVEYKTLSDVLHCMTDSRFTSHQLPGLRDCYEDIWLVVEGEWRPHPSGIINVRRGKRWGPLPGTGRRQMTYSRLAKWFISLEVRGGVRVVRTTSLAETVAVIVSLYRWWTAVPVDVHSSHIQTSMKRGFTDHVGFMPTLPEVRMLAQIDGVGRNRAEAALDHFGSVESAARATEAGWGKVPGFGPVLARKVVEIITRRYNGTPNVRLRSAKKHRSS